MIGGRVLDASAIVAFSSGASIHAAALVWTAVEEGIVLLLPSTALAAAWRDLPEAHHDVLDVLVRLPVTVVDELTGERARAVGAIAGNQLVAHAVLCSRDRGWPVVTADADRYAGVSVDVEPLP